MERFIKLTLYFAMGYLIGTIIGGCLAQASDTIYLEEVAEDAAVRHGIRPEIVKAIITVESSWNPDAVGALGEVGLLQMRPEFHPAVIQSGPEEQIELGVRYLAYVKGHCIGDYGHAWFVCFNAGPFHRYKAPTKTPYYNKVMEAMR